MNIFIFPSGICPRPSLDNGYVFGTGGTLRPGRNVTFRCDTGYVLNGSALATCQNDRSWSPGVPSCDLDTGILHFLMQVVRGKVMSLVVFVRLFTGGVILIPWYTGIHYSGGSKWRRVPLVPLRQNFFIFMHLSGKIGQIMGWCPPCGTPPSGRLSCSFWIFIPDTMLFFFF